MEAFPGHWRGRAEDQDRRLPADPRRRRAGGRAPERRDRRGRQHPAAPGHHHRQSSEALPLDRAEHPHDPAHVLHAPVRRPAQAAGALRRARPPTSACARPSPPRSTPTRSSRACSTARPCGSPPCSPACTSASIPSLKPVKQDLARTKKLLSEAGLPQRRRDHAERPAGPLRARQGGGRGRRRPAGARRASGRRSRRSSS